MPHWLAKGASNVPAETGDDEDDDEDPFGHAGALDERDKEGARSAHEADPTDYNVNTLVLGSGVVHHTHETWLMRIITFCGKCESWATTAPRLLTKECAMEPGKRAYELKCLIAGKEPKSQNSLAKRYAAFTSTHVPWARSQSPSTREMLCAKDHERLRFRCGKWRKQTRSSDRSAAFEGCCGMRHLTHKDVIGL